MKPPKRIRIRSAEIATNEVGSLTAMLNSCDENVEWLGVTGSDNMLPLVTVRRGRLAVAQGVPRAFLVHAVEHLRRRRFRGRDERTLAAGAV